MGMAEKKKNNTPPTYVLPSENSELQNFSKKFKLDMMDQVVNAVEFALEHELPLIEVFQFKNSDFVITLSEKDYITNLDNVYSYYMEREAYEHCPRVVRLLNTLKEKSLKIISDEKQKSAQ